MKAFLVTFLFIVTLTSQAFAANDSQLGEEWASSVVREEEHKLNGVGCDSIIVEKDGPHSYSIELRGNPPFFLWSQIMSDVNLTEDSLSYSEKICDGGFNPFNCETTSLTATRGPIDQNGKAQLTSVIIKKGSFFLSTIYNCTL